MSQIQAALGAAVQKEEPYDQCPLLVLERRIKPLLSNFARMRGFCFGQAGTKPSQEAALKRACQDFMSGIRVIGMEVDGVRLRDLAVCELPGKIEVKLEKGKLVVSFHVPQSRVLPQVS